MLNIDRKQFIQLFGCFCLFVAESRKPQTRTLKDDNDSRLQWKLIKAIKVSLFDSLPFQQIRSSLFLSCHLSVSPMWTNYRDNHMCVYRNTAWAQGFSSTQTQEKVNSVLFSSVNNLHIFQRSRVKLWPISGCSSVIMLIGVGYLNKMYNSHAYYLDIS